MTTCDKKYLEARCHERGYTLDEVMPCVVAQDGDQWTIDTGHPAYPSTPKHSALPTAGGPGTELKKLLSRVGITSTPTCKCNARAAEMDRQGCDWVEANVDTVVGWLREEATKRGLPFVDMAGRMLVKRAIKNARKQDGSSLPDK
jgi:hypothetical protein